MFLIYPAYLVPKQGDELVPEMKVSDKTPPTFITMALNDPLRIECATSYASALRKANVPFELHVYEDGGHWIWLEAGEGCAEHKMAGACSGLVASEEAAVPGEARRSRLASILAKRLECAVFRRFVIQDVRVKKRRNTAHSRRFARKSIAVICLQVVLQEL